MDFHQFWQEGKKHVFIGGVYVKNVWKLFFF